MNRAKQIREDYDATVKLALQEVEDRARRILRRHPPLTEFCMAMGTAFFVTTGGSTLGTDDRAYMRSLDDFLREWDDFLHLTGHPMRFTADGDVVTDW
jgi:hypothetical protein